MGHTNACTTFILAIFFSLLINVDMYLCEMIFAIFCLYFIHIDIGYECIVFSCIVKINLLLLCFAHSLPLRLL